MNKKTKIILGEVFLLLTLLLILFVRAVDVAAIGPQGTSIGLSHLNGGIFALFGTSHFFYVITKLIGYFAILVAIAVALGLIFRTQITDFVNRTFESLNNF